MRHRSGQTRNGAAVACKACPATATPLHDHRTTSRLAGSRGAEIFRSDDDGRVFLSTLGGVIAERGWHCHATA